MAEPGATSRRKWSAFIALILSLAFSFYGVHLYRTNQFNASHAADLTMIVGGEESLRIIASSEKVELFRLKPRPYEELRDGMLPSDFPTASNPIALSTSEVNVIRKALLRPSSYVWDTAKGCIPRWGVLVRFTHGNQVFEAYFCLECQIVAFARDSKWVGGEDFDPIASLIKQIVKRHFPKDDEIQSL